MYCLSISVSTREIWVERLDLPKIVKIGESYEASVLVGSLMEQEVELVLEENGSEVFRGQVQLNEWQKADHDSDPSS